MSARSLHPLRITALLLVGSCILLLAACGGTSNPNTNTSASVSTAKPTTTPQSQQRAITHRQGTSNNPTPTLTPSSDLNSSQVKTGTIQRLEVTSFMYGTHALFDNSGKILYALRSHTLDLSAYIGKHVEVTGTLVPGYPVDGGPPFLDVSKVQEI